MQTLPRKKFIVSGGKLILFAMRSQFSRPVARKRKTCYIIKMQTINGQLGAVS